MTLQEASIFATKYSSVIFLNRLLPIRFRSVITSLSFVIFILAAGTIALLELESRFHFLTPDYTALLAPVLEYRAIIGLVAAMSAFLCLLLYPLLTYSRYFLLRSVERVFSTNNGRFTVSYEAARALLAGKQDGLMEGLLSVPESNFILGRLLMSSQDMRKYSTPVTLDDDIVVSEYNETVTLGSLWKLFYENSDDLKKDLLSKKITKDIYHDTCNWLDRTLEDEKKESAWWWRENLSKTRGIGKSLSYGRTDVISKYARELALDGTMNEVGKVLLHKEAITHLEETLAKNHGANAVIVGGRGTGKHTVVKILARMIDTGDCYAEIEHKRVFEFDNNVLGSLETGELISAVGRCFEEALIARNIIFVFNDFPTLSTMLQNNGVDIFQLIERYINDKNISIVCICDQSFYQNEAHKALFDKDFDAIHIEDMNSRLLVPYIQDHAVIIERITGKFFPSHSVSVIALALNRYFVEDSPLVKTHDLMYKIATSTSKKGEVILDDESVSDTIKSITGISTGEILGDEKEKLLNLEAILHKNVMGQDEAIKVVASTMRRSRAGLTNANKPIGSFLFLGPTGVGKTETAKTLASVFFGSESHLSRIDMNEYTMSNSSYRLLGNANEEGDIAKLVHERPYGVLLLDEFEKSTPDVKDIFLRVLDEGVFTNGAGKVISARTQIIIATSNAGSSYIKESGLTQNSTKDEIEAIKNSLVDAIISEGLFRPELINRFDAVVLFHPLGDDSRMLVAKKMLESLQQRTSQEGYTVTFTDALVTKVLGNEADSAFGGRAIQRNIQTEVEEALARKIIDGSLKPGDAIVLDAVDIV